MKQTLNRTLCSLLAAAALAAGQVPGHRGVRARQAGRRRDLKK